MAGTKDSPEAAKELSNMLTIPDASFSELEDMMCATDCPEGCEVEPDGYCSHGFRSAGLTLGII